MTEHYNLAAEPHPPEQIRELRTRLGTQRKCAALAGVDLSLWQYWEAGKRRPAPNTWGLFLLAIGQHPTHEIKTRQGAEEQED